MKLSNLTFLTAFLFLTACVSAPKGPQKLELKSPTTSSKTAYQSNSLSKEYAGDELIREKQESVEFVVETSPAPKNEDPVSMVLKTTAKDGLLTLNDFGFPELNESIEFHYTSQGKVLKAGNFKPFSLFFVPPLPLPDRPVVKGDTWDLSHSWVSQSGLELKLDVIGIHKGFKRCGESSPCVDIEISGSVNPANQRIVGVDLTSKISGHVLFSLKEGDVYSSKVFSEESLQFPERRIESKSCMVSKPIEEGKALKDVSFPKCKVK